MFAVSATEKMATQPDVNKDTATKLNGRFIMLASQFHQWLQIKSDNNALKFLQENCYDLILIRIRSLANARLVSSKKEYSHAA